MLEFFAFVKIEMMIKFFLKKEILLIFFLSILISGLIYFFNSSKNEPVEAGAEHNVFGWAWSSNIGWISFNSTSGGGAVNYGVNIGSDGIFSGYAWSQNIGWIKFNPSGPYPGPPNHSAKLDSDTKRITGWIRALNHNDDWDGWIFLGPIVKEGTDYGVKINDTPNPAQFEGWAWSSDVIGWISFNCSNNQGVCSNSDYKVSTTFVFNRPPNKPDIPSEYPEGETWNHCVYKEISIPTFHWTYSDPEGDPQVSYEINWYNNTTSTTRLVTGSSTAYTLTPEEAGSLGWNTAYDWRVRVKDNKGNWSEWSDSNSFTTPIHAYPWVDFTWEPENPNPGEEVNFTNRSVISAPAVAFWTFEDGDPANVAGWTAITEFLSKGWKIVTLTVIDSEGYSCRKESSVNVGGVEDPPPLPPRRYEVIPIR